MRVDEDALTSRAAQLKADGGRMQVAYLWRPAATGRPELRFIVAPGSGRDFAIWAVDVSPTPPSLVPVWPSLAWSEREIMDGSCLRFDGHPDPTPLLHDTGEDPGLPALAEPGAQILPYGPVRADVVESAQFSFLYVGEHILHYRPHLFLKRRGVEARFEGMTPERGVVLAERVSGVGSVAHALAYCAALEDAARCTVPPRAGIGRALAAEIERLYNHLHYLGHLCGMTTLKVGEAEGRLLEERVKQLASRIFGHRLMFNVVAPGGLRRDYALPPAFEASLNAIERDFDRYVRLMERSASHQDRLTTTGRLPQDIAFDHGATGPVERASGIDRDLRRDHPYAAYGDFEPAVCLGREGDAAARATVRIEEVRASLALIRRLARARAGGALRAVCAVPPEGEGLGWVEGARGSLFYAVHLDDTGRLARVKIRSPSFSNWRAFAFTVHDSNMMDYAINEASFGLTIAGAAG